MNRNIVSVAAIAFLLTGIFACNGKSKDSESTTEAAVKKSDEAKGGETANSAKTYTLGFAPDSVILGKEKEALVKVLSGEAVELSDPDGKSTGMSIKIKLRATNKSTLDAKKYFDIKYGEARLELDNGTNTTCERGDALNPDPEASLDGTWDFTVPAGAKPTKLNLFYDGTRVAVAIALK